MGYRSIGAARNQLCRTVVAPYSGRRAWRRGVGCSAAHCLGDLRAGRRGDADRRSGRDGAERRAGAGAVAPAGDIAVAVKGQQTLMLGGAPSRIAIGDPEVADVKVLPASGKRAASVLVYGKKAGTTQLQVWSGANAAPQVWNVRVSGPVQGVLAGRGVSGGANVDMAGDKAVLSGHAESQLSHQGSVSAAASAVGGETWWTCPPPGRAAWSRSRSRWSRCSVP